MSRFAVTVLGLLAAAGAASAQPDPHAGHVMRADPHAGHVMAAPVQAGAPPPDPAADAVFGAAPMDAARSRLRAEHGGMRFAKAALEIAEYRPSSRGAGYGWEAEASYGGDLRRFVLTTQGEGQAGDLHEAEVQALYSRAIDPYFDLRVGLRQDFEPRPRRVHAVVGVEGLAPYGFEVEAAAFVSGRGDLGARLEAGHELRLTQRLALRGQVEVDLEADGPTAAEAGLRLRYAVTPQASPYVGLLHRGRSGEDAEDTRLVVGLRASF